MLHLLQIESFLKIASHMSRLTSNASLDEGPHERLVCACLHMYPPMNPKQDLPKNAEELCQDVCGQWKWGMCCGLPAGNLTIALENS